MPGKLLTLIATVLTLSACAQYTDNRGSEVSWGAASVERGLGLR